MNALYYAHSGLRYLVLLAGLLAVVVLATGLSGKRPFDRGGRGATAAFNGLLDLQIVLGVLLVALGRYYPQVIGHLMMMVLAAVVTHVASVFARKQPDVRKQYQLALAGVVIALVLIVLGIGAIGRGPFESRAIQALEQAE